MANQSNIPDDVVDAVEEALNDRLDLWRNNSKWAVEHIEKPDIAKTNSVVATAGLVGVGMQAASAFVPSMAAPLAIPTFLFADAAGLFQSYFRNHMAEAKKDLSQAEDQVKAALRTRIDNAARRFKGGPQYREIRDFIADRIASRHGVGESDPAFKVAQGAVDQATIGGKSFMPVENMELRRYVSDHYNGICRNVYEIYKAINPETVAGAKYPPFIRARNRTGKFSSLGELEAFCVNPKQGNVGCHPDVNAYVVQGHEPGSGHQPSDFAVLMGHAWMLKLVERPAYARAARLAPMPDITHVEIVPAERDPIRPVWTGVGRTKQALAEAIDRAVPGVREKQSESA